MRSSPVVIVLPLGHLRLQVMTLRLGDRPGFLAIGFLRALHFAIQMRGGKLNGTEFDAVVYNEDEEQQLHTVSDLYQLDGRTEAQFMAAHRGMCQRRTGTSHFAVPDENPQGI